MKTSIRVIVMMIVGLAASSCGVNPDYSEFVNDEIGISFEYPAGYAAETLQGPAEVARYALNNQFKLPVLVASVNEREHNADLPESARKFRDALRARIPGSAGFTISDEKPVNLDDGTDALLFNVDWIWIDGSTEMETVAVGAFKGDRVVILSVTAMKNQNLSEKITELCMTLRTSL